MCGSTYIPFMFNVNTVGDRFISGRGANPKPGAEIYYFNFSSGESRWEHPQDEHFKDLYRRSKVLETLDWISRYRVWSVPDLLYTPALLYT